MQCPCGGATAIRTATDRGVSLIYQQCSACGRVGGEELYRGGEMVAKGTSARQQFNEWKEAQ